MFKSKLIKTFEKIREVWDELSLRPSINLVLLYNLFHFLYLFQYWLRAFIEIKYHNAVGDCGFGFAYMYLMLLSFKVFFAFLILFLVEKIFKKFRIKKEIVHNKRYRIFSAISLLYLIFNIYFILAVLIVY